jgi:integrase
MARRRYQQGCIFKRGKNWVIRFREDRLNPEGEAQRVLRSVVLGEFGTRYEAQREASRYLQRINSTSYRPQVSITLNDFWDRHFESTVLPMFKHSTQDLYRILATRHILPAFGVLRLDEIPPVQVQRFIQQKQAQGYSPQTLAHLRNLLSKFFRTGIRWGWIETNPAQGVELPPMERRRTPRVLALGEIQRLARNLTDPGRTIFLVAVLTGLRVGELLALRVEDVDLARATLSVRQSVYNNHVSTPKTRGSERKLPIPTLLGKAIRQWLRVRPNTSEWLFPSKARTPLNNRNVLYRHIWPACDRLEIPRFRWHALRHTFSTYQGNEGVPMPVLQSLLGHSHADTTMLYTHPLREAERGAVEQLARVLFPNVPTFGRVVKPVSKLIQ